MRGQFDSIEEFLDSMREYTFPVLAKINTEQGSIVFKKDNLWNKEVCHGITLNQLAIGRYIRYPEMSNFKIKLLKLINQEPFWDDADIHNLTIKEYGFDKQFSECFDTVNCFMKAIVDDGRIILFFHPEYRDPTLRVIVLHNGIEKKYLIDNIYSISWWEYEPQIKHWTISPGYYIEIRAREFDFHPPHFHVRLNEYEAVFKLSDGSLYKYGKKEWKSWMITDIQEWFKNNKIELKVIWDSLH